MKTRWSIFLSVLAVFAFGPLTAAPANAEAVTLSREQLLASLSRDVAGHFNLEGSLELDLIRAWAAPTRTARQWDVVVTDYPNTATSAMLLRCRLVADGEALPDITLMLRASLWRDVWSTREPLTIGATFDPALLETRRVDLFREREALPTAVGDRSYIFSRGVAAGHILTWRDISRRPLVRKGQVVDVSATEGMLVVTMKAVAMENGAQGDTVTVRNPDSRKDFAALVVDENRVQVRF
ncbi:flagellar basal body P-ring formation chaperone FlgA [Opitutus sp. ER46]|uniref:flagellar basal body P-ring formation chaperone FlgA n=1 Tax=Opitutus sp. ER46 TaxID=2161864 RepID=UPI000D30CF22|nr:flagellar basal body P-ring formation chaperone FlgA [Opitutus sp. ER46]PTX90922.1 flagella basal body P-ring formation protein FlgA [Opitutus sp. ER46]